MKDMTKEEKMTVKVGDQEKVITIKYPTSRIEAEANMYASKIFAKLAKEQNEGGSLLLRAQLDEYLRSIGLYTENDIKNITEIQETIDKLEAALIKGGAKKSEGRKTAIELRRNRYTLLLLLAKRMEYDRNTIEYHSESGRINYIISKCLCDEAGDPIFNSVEDYEFDDTGLKDDLVEAIKRVGSICSSYDPDYEKKLPENKFLSKYGFCNESFDLIDSEGHLVNEHGKRIDKDGNELNENGEVVKVEKEIGEFLED